MNMNGYFVYILSIIYISGIAMCLDFLFSCFLKFRNALRNENTDKLVFIFKCMRSSS